MESPADEIERLARLRDRGDITDAEYELLKSQIVEPSDPPVAEVQEAVPQAPTRPADELYESFIEYSPHVNRLDLVNSVGGANLEIGYAPTDLTRCVTPWTRPHMFKPDQTGNGMPVSIYAHSHHVEIWVLAFGGWGDINPAFAPRPQLDQGIRIRVLVFPPHLAGLEELQEVQPSLAQTVENRIDDPKEGPRYWAGTPISIERRPRYLRVRLGNRGPDDLVCIGHQQALYGGGIFPTSVKTTSKGPSLTTIKETLEQVLLAPKDLSAPNYVSQLFESEGKLPTAPAVPSVEWRREEEQREYERERSEAKARIEASRKEDEEMSAFVETLRKEARERGEVPIEDKWEEWNEKRGPLPDISDPQHIWEFIKRQKEFRAEQEEERAELLAAGMQAAREEYEAKIAETDRRSKAEREAFSARVRELKDSAAELRELSEAVRREDAERQEEQERQREEQERRQQERERLIREAAERQEERQRQREEQERRQEEAARVQAAQEEYEAQRLEEADERNELFQDAQTALVRGALSCAVEAAFSWPFDHFGEEGPEPHREQLLAEVQRDFGPNSLWREVYASIANCDWTYFEVEYLDEIEFFDAYDHELWEKFQIGNHSAFGRDLGNLLEDAHYSDVFVLQIAKAIASHMPLADLADIARSESEQGTTE